MGAAPAGPAPGYLRRRRQAQALAASRDMLDRLSGWALRAFVPALQSRVVHPGYAVMSYVALETALQLARDGKSTHRPVQELDVDMVIGHGQQSSPNFLRGVHRGYSATQPTTRQPRSVPAGRCGVFGAVRERRRAGA